MKLMGDFLTQMELDNTGFGNDLESTRDALDHHNQVHREVINYRKHVDQCIAQRVSLRHESLPTSESV